MRNPASNDNARDLELLLAEMRRQNKRDLELGKLLAEQLRRQA